MAALRVLTSIRFLLIEGATLVLIFAQAFGWLIAWTYGLDFWTVVLAGYVCSFAIFWVGTALALVVALGFSGDADQRGEVPA